MQERELPGWFVNEWTDLKAAVRGIDTKLDGHLNNHHGRHPWRDWGIKGGVGAGGVGLIVLAKQVIEALL